MKITFDMECTVIGRKEGYPDSNEIGAIREEYDKNGQPIYVFLPEEGETFTRDVLMDIVEKIDAMSVEAYKQRVGK